MADRRGLAVHPVILKLAASVVGLAAGGALWLLSPRAPSDIVWEERPVARARRALYSLSAMLNLHRGERTSALCA